MWHPSPLSRPPQVWVGQREMRVEGYPSEHAVTHLGSLNPERQHLGSRGRTQVFRKYTWVHLYLNIIIVRKLLIDQRNYHNHVILQCVHI